MSTRKIILTVFLSAILLSMISYFPSTAIAECQCGDEGCYRLTVQVLGYEGYIVHDEMVMIRYFGGNVSSPVLYENRTIVDGVAYLCVEGGEYWIDVRNIWVNLTIDGDVDFVFPYLLFDDVENSTDNDKDSNPEAPSKPDIVLWLGIVVVIIVVAMLSLLVIEKRKKK